MTTWTGDVFAGHHRLRDLNQLLMVRNVEEGRPALIEATDPLTIRVEDGPVLHLKSTNGAGHVTAGHPENVVEARNGATLFGGDDGAANEVRRSFGTVGGGRGNIADGTDAVVGGGVDNESGNRATTVAGGAGNRATHFAAAIAGGANNKAGGGRAAIGGGQGNEATGAWATIAGGRNNKANGDYSFAAGRGATADHNGAFVFGDSSDDRITSKCPDEMRFQMPIYTLGVNNTSARSAKTNIKPVDPLAALEGVESLEISTWEFRDHDSGQHMGPMAEDFTETFGLGDDDESIATIDAEGVALAAIQGLASELDEKTDRLDEKSDRIDGLKTETEKNSTQIDDLEQEVAEKNERLTKIEQEHEALQEQYTRLAERIEELEEGSLS